MKKVVKITEAQLSKIVEKVLKEQAQAQPSAYKESQFTPKNYGSLFDLGKYEDTNGKIRQAIESDKEALIKFMNSQDFANFTAKIIAGESQVTNPAEFKQKGSLALARAKTVASILDDVYSDLINSGRLKIVMPALGEVQIGKTPYKPGDQNDPAKLEKYKQEQFVSMRLTGFGKTLKCNEPFPVKGKKGEAPNFEFVYNEELNLNPKIKGINYQAYTIPDRPILINANGERTSPPYFVREKEGEGYQEQTFPLELALKFHLYPSSEAFKGVELVDAYASKIRPYISGGVSAQQQAGAVLVKLLGSVQSDLTPELQKLYGDLVKASNILSVQVFNANAAVLKDVFSKSPKIVTNPNGSPFNVNMQQTPSIKVGSYAPLDNTVFAITPFC